MTKRVMYVPLIVVTMIITLVDLLPIMSNGASTPQIIQLMCEDKVMNNVTARIQTFVSTMDNIRDQIETKGWGSSQTGSGPDSNYGLAQCHGDIPIIDCVLCFSNARSVIPQCFPYNGGRVYLDNCFVRNENYSFFGEAIGPKDTYVCGNSTRKDPMFEETARRAVLEVISDAPDKGGFSRAHVRVSGDEWVYVLGDCWKSLNSSGCRVCLERAFESLLKCLPWSEGRALFTGCFMRYSDTNFLNLAPADQGSSRGNVVAIIASTVSVVTVLVVGLAIGFCIWRQKQIEKKREGSNDSENLARILDNSSLSFNYYTLEKATESFAEANKLGQGAFGSVYKGVLGDGREIAVKRLIFNYKHRPSYFYNEVNIISSVDHKNLIRLLGCSCAGPESLLVYEFLPNLSLDRFIFDENKGKDLDWGKRFNIIVGVAQGLVYLHENSKKRIIHRDIKASNILLDSRFRAKIADFGLARSFQEEESQIHTILAGTLGYLAPEYVVHGQLSEKVDVYSFGVLLLEIVTGKQNNMNTNVEYSDSMVNTAWMHFQEGKMDELFDPNLMLNNNNNSNNNKLDVLRVAHVGLLCIQEMPSLRPTMSMVLQMLVNYEEELPSPSNPPFINEKIMQHNNIIDSPTFPFAQSGCTSNPSHVNS